MQAPTTLATPWNGRQVRRSVSGGAGLVQRGGPGAPWRGLWLEAQAPGARSAPTGPSGLWYYLVQGTYNKVCPMVSSLPHWH